MDILRFTVPTLLIALSLGCGGEPDVVALGTNSYAIQTRMRSSNVLVAQLAAARYCGQRSMYLERGGVIPSGGRASVRFACFASFPPWVRSGSMGGSGSVFSLEAPGVGRDDPRLPEFAGYFCHRLGMAAFDVGIYSWAEERPFAVHFECR